MRPSRRPRSKYTAYTLMRKWTTPVHWAFGVFCGLLVLRFWPLTVILMIIFARWEKWNDENNYVVSEGDIDWHEYFAALIITVVPIFFLDLAGKVTVPWWGPVT